MMIVERATIATKTPTQTAEAFRLRLALEKGFTSTVKLSGNDLLVIASDGQAVRFTKSYSVRKAKR